MGSVALAVVPFVAFYAIASCFIVLLRIGSLGSLRTALGGRISGLIAGRTAK